MTDAPTHENALGVPRPRGQWSGWWPDALAGLAVFALGLLETLGTDPSDRLQSLVVVLGFAGGVTLSRRLPGAALVLVWLTGGYQLLTLTPVLWIEVAVAIVAFGTARWGRPVTVVLSALSIPAAAAVLVLGANPDVLSYIRRMGDSRQAQDAVSVFGGAGQVGTVAVFVALLAAPWAVGLAVRFLVDARRSDDSRLGAEADPIRAHRDAALAQEVADLRDDQARLARDVHDVVGHSLAVILAQAESAQFLPDDPTALKQTMTTIATSARSSLQDIRQVLTTTSTTAPGAPVGAGDLDALVAGVRAAGQIVVVDETGTSRPLPPEVEIVAYRVTQEMLTNAVRHGMRGQPIRVERQWPTRADERDLRIRVSNAATDTTQRSSDGQGIAGMRRRVEALGGWFDIDRRPGADGTDFVATAWIPVRR